MDKKISIGICMILLVGIVAAGLLDYYGQIEQSFEVSGLVFYLDGDGNNLLMNEIPNSEETIIIGAGEEVILETNFVGEFGNPIFNIIIWAKADNSGDVLEFGILKNDENICNPSDLTITATTQFTKKQTDCSSSENVVFESGDEIKLSVSGKEDNVGNIEIKTGKEYGAGYSRIEVTST